MKKKEKTEIKIKTQKSKKIKNPENSYHCHYQTSIPKPLRFIPNPLPSHKQPLRSIPFSFQRPTQDPRSLPFSSTKPQTHQLNQPNNHRSQPSHHRIQPSQPIKSNRSTASQDHPWRAMTTPPTATHDHLTYGEPRLPMSRHRTTTI